MLVKTFCAAVNGLDVTTVTIEVSMTRGVLYHLTGLPDSAVTNSPSAFSFSFNNVSLKP